MSRTAETNPPRSRLLFGQRTKLDQVVRVVASILVGVSTFAGGRAIDRSTIGNLLVSIRNINDPPVANVSTVQIAATQDVALDYNFDTAFPDGLFTDIDSVKLTWSLTAIGFSQMPAWLTFDPTARTLKGIPANADVGTFEFQLRAADSIASASIPLRITVANVNDPPTQDKSTHLICLF